MHDFYAFVATHHGVFSRAEAAAFGITNNKLSGMLRRGEAIRTHPSTYQLTSHQRTWRSHLRSAAISAEGVASHRAAAVLWEIDGYAETIPEIVIDETRCITLPDIKVHRSRQFGRIDRQIVDGIPVTGIARTVLDLAAVVGPRRLELTVDAVLRQRLVEWPDLYDVLVRHSAKGRDGCGRLRQLLEVRYGESAIPDSAWNRIVGTLLLDAGLPEPRYEVEIREGDRFVARVDLAYERQKLAIELDSVRWHLNQTSFVEDPRRKNNLLLAGWRVLTFTWTDYTERPHHLVDTVRRVLL